MNLTNTLFTTILFIGTTLYAQEALTSTSKNSNHKFAGVTIKQADSAMLANARTKAQKIKSQKIMTAKPSQIVETPERAKKRTTLSINPAPGK